MEKGIYCLILRNPACTVRVGALGEISFEEGWHCYVGSALGPGGLSRAWRHVRLWEEGGCRPRWHIDYLLLSGRFRPVCLYTAETTARYECPLAREIGGDSVAGFGSSDCKCRSHLFCRPQDPEAEVRKAFLSLDLLATGTRLK